MKKIVLILLGIAVAALLAIVTLISLIDPNQFKPQLAEQVRKSTGRELVMAGEIDWRFWPSLGLALEKVALRNPARARPRWPCCRCSPIVWRLAR